MSYKWLKKQKEKNIIETIELLTIIMKQNFERELFYFCVRMIT